MCKWDQNGCGRYVLLQRNPKVNPIILKFYDGRGKISIDTQRESKFNVSMS